MTSRTMTSGYTPKVLADLAPKYHRICEWADPRSAVPCLRALQAVCAVQMSQARRRMATSLTPPLITLITNPILAYRAWSSVMTSRRQAVVHLLNGGLPSCDLPAGSNLTVVACMHGADEAGKEEDDEKPATPLIALVTNPILATLLLCPVLMAAGFTFLDPVLGPHLTSQGYSAGMVGAAFGIVSAVYACLSPLTGYAPLFWPTAQKRLWRLMPRAALFRGGQEYERRWVGGGGGARGDFPPLKPQHVLDVAHHQPLLEDGQGFLTQ